eukprot:5339789-Alexandrium_andersonii.AAC.1
MLAARTPPTRPAHHAARAKPGGTGRPRRDRPTRGGAPRGEPGANTRHGPKRSPEAGPRSKRPAGPES